MVKSQRHAPRVQGLYIDRNDNRLILLVEPSSFVAPPVEERRATPAADRVKPQTALRADAIALAFSCVFVIALIAACFTTNLYNGRADRDTRANAFNQFFTTVDSAKLPGLP
jgi:hypothetical protein